MSNLTGALINVSSATGKELSVITGRTNLSSFCQFLPLVY
jgi:hypothetical protein